MTAAAEQSCAASVRLPQPPREDIIHVTHPPTQQCVDLALPLTVAGLTGTGQMAVWCSSLPHMLAFKHAAAERSVVAASAKRRVIVSDTNTHSQDESRVSRWWLWCQKSTRLSPLGLSLTPTLVFLFGFSMAAFSWAFRIFWARLCVCDIYTWVHLSNAFAFRSLQDMSNVSWQYLAVWQNKHPQALHWCFFSRNAQLQFH